MNQAAGKTEFGDFLSFETLTLCPIDTRCIDTALLREDERAWLDAYHRTCGSACRRSWTAHPTDRELTLTRSGKR